MVETAPRLEDGSPFPTLFYLTCPRAAAALSRLESAGVMREMEQRLAAEPELRAAQRAAHRDYLARRDAAAAADGAPHRCRRAHTARVARRTRVKRLHALAAHELAVPGANRLGRAAADAAGGVVVARPVRPVTAPAVTRVAAIDCGTNSLRLLVADASPAAGRLTDVDRRMEIVRLGQGVDATGQLAPEALDRTLRALAGDAKIIRATSAGAVRMVATSATRTRPTPPTSSAASRRCSA